MQDIIGKKFSRWTVLEYSGKNEGIRHWYLVQCECGNKSEVERNILKQGKTTQCRSCARKKYSETHINPSQTHGYSSPKHQYFRIYNIWSSMKARCLNEKNKQYKNYGGRGIKVCESWKNSFEEFLKDMGNIEPSFTLDRIDVNGNYCKENCRWTTLEVQANNCRTNIYHEESGLKMSETQWSRYLGISRNKMMHWARKNGILWVIENIEKIKKIKKGMSDKDYLDLELELPPKRYRD